MSVLAIDPGRHTGWALVTEGTLVKCGLGAPPDSTGVDRVFIERPQVYRARMSKGDPNDLITLAIQVGEYKYRMTSCGSLVELVLPHDWKGTVDAEVLCRRVVNVLTGPERELLFHVLAPLARKPMTMEFLASGRRHNVIDAVGIALWSVGSRLPARFDRLVA